ncbi:MAG: FAD-dependent thymidylate synthase, partial [Campylobacterales bacterium]
IWRLLHAHPYYNSEQVSQRYAKMTIENCVYPAGGDQAEWEAYYGACFEDYERLIEVLLPDVEAVVPKFRKKDSRKKAQEMARYVLPGGMSAYLYHTVNVITLLRYIAVAKAMPECREEAVQFAEILAEKLVEMDASLAPLVEHAKAASPVFPAFDMAALRTKIGVTDENVKVYDVVGDAAFDVNENYADVLRYSQMLLDQGVLGGFSTYTRLSLSADAQNQRHRRSPAVRPALESIYARQYYTPPIIARNPEAFSIYKRAIEAGYDFFEAQRDKLGFGEAAYALPNAHEIELVERDDFTSFHHKAQMRLCYNAQEEIFDVVYEQVKQLRAMGVPGAEELLPPCATRFAMKIRPTCPEGDHFCGIKVWKLDFEDYKREI